MTLRLGDLGTTATTDEADATRAVGRFSETRLKRERILVVACDSSPHLREGAT
jgi:hypothetical protein